MSDRDDLNARIDRLSPVGVRFVARFVDSLGTPPVARLTMDQWNDEPGRTVEDVVLAFKHAAAGERLG
jgi:hypothetical protein